MKKQRAIIVGASHAAAQLSTSLRQEGWQGDIIMIGDEASLPYHRPPLSKTFLLGGKIATDLLIRPAAFYDKNNIQYRQGHVTAIDRQQQTITLSDGNTLTYDKLALCTGASVNKLALSGSELHGVHYLRQMADVDAIKSHLAHAKHAVIIGGGYIGLETAAALRQQGMTVTVLEMASRILHRVTAPELSAFYSRVHHEEGVTIQTGVTINAIVGTTHVEGVACANGTTLPADLVIIGVGVTPNVALAETAGITVDNGIVIDAHCRTSDPHIVAAGDCSNQFNPYYQRRMRLESVPNASEQAKVAAATLCGINTEYKSLPWFWSDQYDLKLQIAGLSQGYDQLVLRGNPHKGRSFAAFYFKHGQLIAADCINHPQAFMLSKKLIVANRKIDPHQLADESLAITSFL